MSREIKFRGRRVDNDKWVYGQYFKAPLTDENSGTTPDAGWFFLSGEPRHCIVQDGVSFVIDEKTVSEYTGLTDKNGTEIYEGDILNVLEVSDFSTQEYKSPVEFIESGFLVTEPNETQVPLACFYNPNGGYPLFETEVIGNIYENAGCAMVTLAREPEEPACRVCGCTENNACPGGCWWVEADLCSSCVGADLTDKPSSAPLPEGSE